MFAFRLYFPCAPLCVCVCFVMCVCLVMCVCVCIYVYGCVFGACRAPYGGSWCLLCVCVFVMRVDVSGCVLGTTGHLVVAHVLAVGVFVMRVCVL